MNTSANSTLCGDWLNVISPDGVVLGTTDILLQAFGTGDSWVEDRQHCEHISCLIVLKDGGPDHTS